MLQTAYLSLEIMLGLILILPIAYFLLLTLIAIWPHRAAKMSAPPATRFAILVPAHDEAAVIGQLLSNLERLDYPRSLFDVHVIADNCSDETAEICRAAGVNVHERFDVHDIGKGYALRWGHRQVEALERDVDAYLIIDADCTVSENTLRVLDRELVAGAAAVQSYYVVANPGDSAAASIRYLAMALKHYVRPLGRKRLGLSCGLFGTGMVFQADVLREHGWGAFGLTEDIETFMGLIDSGKHVAFAPDARVMTDAPVTLKQAETQNLRWETGRLRAAWKYGVRFMLSGLVKRNFKMVDAAVEQIVPPAAILAVSLPVLSVAGFIAGFNTFAILSGTAFALFALGTLIGFVSVRAPLRAYRSLLFLPWFIAWKVRVYILALANRADKWTRTERPSTPS